MLLLISPATAESETPASGDSVTITYFWAHGCPHCDNQRRWLDSMLVRYPELRVAAFEVSRDAGNRRRYVEMAEAHGFLAQAVPATFLLGRSWVGFSPAVAREIEAVVKQAVSGVEQREESGDQPGMVLSLPVFGDVTLAEQSLLAATLLIAFVDGFNPCSLWVLTLLLGIVIHSGSRGRVFLVGGTFLGVTALMYGVFIAGLFTVLAVVGVLWWVRLLVAGVAGTFGVINIKDYFRYKVGPSLTIPESRKPGIYRDIRRLLEPGRSWPALVGATAVMAAGIALVELPCTAGFPVIWSGLVTTQQVAAPAFALLLAAYLLVYLLDELIVFGAVVLTLRRSRFEEKHGRVLKLIGGTLMLALAVTLLVAPEAMNTLGGSLAVFAIAAAAVMLVLATQRLAGQPTR